MIDFPASPTVGQQFTAAGATWTWDGTKWLPSGLSPTVVPGINDNRIINGDMRIDQRNNGAGGTASQYTVDRWLYSASVAAKGTWSRYATALAGFPYCLGFGSSSAYAVVAADYFMFQQPIEADMVGDFAWGTAGAQPVTLSFWANSSLSGVFGGAIGNAANTYAYPFTYSLPGGNTWTRIVVTIPGPTAGTWVMSGNAAGVMLFIGLGVGSTYSGPAGAWAAKGCFSANGAVSVVGTNGANLYLTGVKLEIGSVATPFNRQSLAKSMVDCERYFRWLGFNMSFVSASGSNSQNQIVSISPAMRTSPTLGAMVADPNLTQASVNNNSNGFTQATPYSAVAYIQSTGAGQSYVQGYRAPASAEL